MAKRDKKRNDVLIELTQAYIDAASSFIDAEITESRERALRYYDGANPDGLPQPAGRSKIVDPVVRDTIEWVMPSLMRIFAGGDKWISIDPHGPEDAQKARLSEAWVNYVCTRANPGYLLDYQWIRDCLLEKVGWQKLWWETDETSEQAKFSGLTEQDIALIKAQEGVEIESEELGEDGLYTVSVKIERREATLRIATLPPEEVLYLEDATLDRESWWFLAHKSQRRIAELRAMGYDVADDLSGPELEQLDNLERLTESETAFEDDDLAAQVDPGARKVWLYECYVRHDADEDGDAEWLQVMRVGAEILSVEEVDEPPLVCISPILRSHRLTGYSLADLVTDLQELMTALQRAYNDSIYLTVNPRSEIDINGLTEHTVGDLLDNRAGGYVRVRKPGTVLPLVQSPLPAHAMALLEHWQGKLEARTGVTRFNQGLSPDTLNKTATGTNLIMQAANARIELIARNLAETGFRDRVGQILRLSSRHPEHLGRRTLQLSGQALQLSADDLVSSYDLVINTAIGTGNRAEQLGHIQTLIQGYQALSQAGLGPGSQLALYSTTNLYNAFSEYLKLAGWRNTNDFLVDPANPNALRDPVKPPSPSVEQVLAQVEGQKAQVNAMEAQAKAQIEGQKNAMAAQKAQQDAQLEVAKLQLEQQKLGLQERELAMREYELRAKTNAELLRAQAVADKDGVTSVVDFEREMAERQYREREMALKEREAQARLLTLQPPDLAQDPVVRVILEQLQAIGDTVARLAAPKVFERDDSGRVVSINGAPVVRDASGLVAGIGRQEVA